MIFLVLCIAILGATHAQVPDNCDTQNETIKIAIAFENAGIDFVSAPPALLEVIFDSASADLGNLILPVQTILTPEIKFEGAKPKSLYVIIILDCDVPSPASRALACYLILLRVNVKGSDLIRGVTGGFDVAPYIPHSPTPGSGLHHIVALAFEQSCTIETDSRPLLELNLVRERFNLTEFLKCYEIGDEVAGNFWTSELPKCLEKYCTCSSKCNLYS